MSAVRVPYRLEPFGGIGWTVAEFPSLELARAWARYHSCAAMPCWRNAAAWGGEALA